MADDEIVVRFDWDRARERILDISIGALGRMADKLSLLAERADEALRSGELTAAFSPEEERHVRDAGKLLRSTITEWRDACVEKNKARGVTGEYCFDIRAAEAEVERRLAELARSTAGAADADRSGLGVQQSDDASSAVSVFVLGARAPVAAAGEVADLAADGGTGSREDTGGGGVDPQPGRGTEADGQGKVRQVALLGETYDQVRSVMIEGPSGILACTPPDRMPQWVASKRQLIWPNGAVATARPWPGSAAIYRAAEDAGYVFERVEELCASLGLTETVLAAGPVGRFDPKAQLRVTLTNGALTSATRVQLMNGANLAAVGDGTPGNWELVQFSTATPVGPRTYDLTGLLRGQAGTDGVMPAEWPLGSHFVLIDEAVGQVNLELAERRLERHYRIGPAGRSFDDPSYEHVVAAFDGIGLRPYAPSHLQATPNGGDLALSWIRRTRINGDSWESAEVPLGETSELYRLRVMNGPTILRELTLSAQNWTYPAALQAIDGPGARILSVAQIGEIWGAGAEARLQLTL